MKYTKTTEQRLQQLEDKQSILELKISLPKCLR